jgi:PAS domain S-box-containing protein
MSGSIRVLHVDDDPTLGDLVATFLEEEDDRISVVTVEDASEALAALDDHDIDCVVSDYDMPHMNGLQLLDAVRGRSPGLPFILFTGKGSEEIAGEAISRGVDDYLQKETGTEQYAVLANRIGNVVDQYRSERDEQLFRTLIDHATDAVFVIDEETGRFVDVNETATERLGYDRDQLLGMSTYEVSESFDDHEEYLEYMAGGGGDETLTTEDTHVRADGSTVPVEVSASNVEVGEESYRVAIAREITDRKRYEQTLEELHEATRELVGAQSKAEVAEITTEAARETLDCPNTLVRLVTDDGSALEPVAMTAGAETMVGDRPVYPVGEGTAGRAFERGETLVYDDVQQLDDGYDRKRARASIYVPIGDHGTISIGDTEVGTFDETLVRLAEILAANAEAAMDRVEETRAREAEKERLEEFVSVVSHDLRNPLTVLAGSLAVAEQTGDEASFQRCQRALDRIERLVDDLVALSRQSDPVEETGVVDLPGLVDRCWADVDTGAASLRVETDRRIRADCDRAGKLFAALFRTAVEHDSAAGGPASDDGPTVTVTVGDVEGGFYVADDGPRLDAGERAQLFESGYSTADGSRGLALAIAERVAEAHGWSIAVESHDDGDWSPGDSDGSDDPSDGTGTRFVVTGVELVD